MNTEYDEVAHEKVIALVRSDLDKALAEAKDLTARFPSVGRAWASLGYVRAARKEFLLALQAYENRASVAPNEPASHFDVGCANVDLGRYEDANSSFTKGIELSHEHRFDYYLTTLHFFRAYCLCQLGRFDEAVDDLKDLDDDFCFWIGKLQTKAELLEACYRKRANHLHP